MLKNMIMIVFVFIFNFFITPQCNAKEVDWNLKFTVIAHNLNMTVNSSQASFDKAAVNIPPLIEQDGYIYIPARLFRIIDFAQIIWDNQEKFVQITTSTLSPIRYKLNKQNVFIFDIKSSYNDYYTGKYISRENYFIYGFSKLVIPKPFVKNGVMYIPLKAMDTIFGININIENHLFRSDTIKISWLSTEIETNIPKSVNSDKYTFNILYDENLIGCPLSITGLGIQPEDMVTEVNISNKQVVSNGRKYNLAKAKVSLKPGVNLYRSTIMKYSGQIDKYFTINKSTNLGINEIENTMFRKEAIQTLQVKKPEKSFLHLKAPKTITFQTKLLRHDHNGQFITLTLLRNEYNGSYINRNPVKTVWIPINNNEALANLQIKDRGIYTVQYTAPWKYQGYPTPATRLWGEFYLDVK